MDNRLLFLYIMSFAVAPTVVLGLLEDRYHFVSRRGDMDVLGPFYCFTFLIFLGVVVAVCRTVSKKNTDGNK